ncbi:hypothetical protein [Kribbella sp. NPDC048915]|uniref:hypothetical protein n=1 Tax=Kribbella sp. NPDC048915 TaxID=3155148 RepID=UPI0033DEF11B
MPLLVEPALPEGTLRGMPQPQVAVEGGLLLRPWAAGRAVACGARSGRSADV